MYTLLSSGLCYILQKECIPDINEHCCCVEVCAGVWVCVCVAYFSLCAFVHLVCVVLCLIKNDMVVTSLHILFKSQNTVNTYITMLLT